MSTHLCFNSTRPINVSVCRLGDEHRSIGDPGRGSGDWGAEPMFTPEVATLLAESEGVRPSERVVEGLAGRADWRRHGAGCSESRRQGSSIGADAFYGLGLLGAASALISGVHHFSKGRFCSRPSLLSLRSATGIRSCCATVGCQTRSGRGGIWCQEDRMLGASRPGHRVDQTVERPDMSRCGSISCRPCAWNGAWSTITSLR